MVIDHIAKPHYMQVGNKAVLLLTPILHSGKKEVLVL